MRDLKNLYFAADGNEAVLKAADSPDGLPVKHATDLGEALHDPAGYIVDDDLAAAINTAIVLGRPLFVTGEPGTGKSELADHLAYRLGLGQKMKVEIKSTSTSTDLFYTFDSLRQFRDANLVRTRGRSRAGDPEPAGDIEGDQSGAPDAQWVRPYLTFQGLGLAILRTNEASHPDVQRYWDEDRYGQFDGPRRSVVLIDELDKAPRDLPNDLLNELERHYFRVGEDGGRRVELGQGLVPLIVCTSNAEKHLPDAFLRRCIYHHLTFPDLEKADGEDKLRQILANRLSDYPTSCKLLTDVVALVRELRQDSLGLVKPPATAELLDWLAVLRSMDLGADDSIKGRAELRETIGTLIKAKDDLQAAEGRVLSHWFPQSAQTAPASADAAAEEAGA